MSEMRKFAPDVEVRMAIAEFSSLAMGRVSFGRLLDYGQATLSSGGYDATLIRLFLAERMPVHTTGC